MSELESYMKKMETANLADDHWNYISGLLKAVGADQKIIDAGAFLYPTAFVHGYKHAV